MSREFSLMCSNGQSNVNRILFLNHDTRSNYWRSFTLWFLVCLMKFYHWFVTWRHGSKWIFRLSSKSVLSTLFFTITEITPHMNLDILKQLDSLSGQQNHIAWDWEVFPSANTEGTVVSTTFPKKQQQQQQQNIVVFVYCQNEVNYSLQLVTL